jgi:hypothetical protein
MTKSNLKYIEAKVPEKKIENPPPQENEQATPA